MTTYLIPPGYITMLLIATAKFRIFLPVPPSTGERIDRRFETDDWKIVQSLPPLESTKKTQLRLSMIEYVLVPMGNWVKEDGSASVTSGLYWPWIGVTELSYLVTEVYEPRTETSIWNHLTKIVDLEVEFWFTKDDEGNINPRYYLDSLNGRTSLVTLPNSQTVIRVAVPSEPFARNW